LAGETRQRCDFNEKELQMTAVILGKPNSEPLTAAKFKELTGALIRERCPRWSGETRNWKLKDDVWLNPERAEPELLKLAA
jgi:hypothetical protein